MSLSSWHCSKGSFAKERVHLATDALFSVILAWQIGGLRNPLKKILKYMEVCYSLKEAIELNVFFCEWTKPALTSWMTSSPSRKSFRRNAANKLEYDQRGSGKNRSPVIFGQGAIGWVFTTWDRFARKICNRNVWELIHGSINKTTEIAWKYILAVP